MQLTKHAQQRMTKRGITRTMIELTLEYGEPQDEKTVLSKNTTRRLVRELEEKLRTAKKILDKGGCVVVESEDVIVTTYNFTPKKH